ncbi:uncharacterized protein [Rutidosis leptorrhynchoides]|uniref:uncharacterized protein n=1 Tax=Rutidosis leptorrhynchoides TaxID=125765 RepID=UPI003A98E3B9
MKSQKINRVGNGEQPEQRKNDAKTTANNSKQTTRNLMRETNNYILRNAFVGNNPYGGKTTHWSHDSKFMINHKTSVMPLDNTGWNGVDGFKFIHFDDLVIGLVTKYSDERRYGDGDELQNKYIVIDLKDLSGVVLSCTLRGKFMRDFQNHLKEAIDQECASSLTPPPKQLKGWFNDVKAVGCNELAIHNLGIYVVFVEIIVVLPDDEWCYIGCKKCHRKANPADTCVDLTLDIDALLALIRRCSKCQDDPQVCMRYKVNVRVEDKIEDSNGTVSFTLFESQVINYVTKTAYKLQKSLPDGQEKPDELNALTGKKILFKVEVSHYNLKQSNLFFTVKDSCCIC